jgi:hypothetical protein
MSTKTGTASDYLDLLNQLRTFLTSDATLVSLGQNWTELATTSTPYNHVDNGITNVVDFESFLKGPGLSGTEAIFINLQAFHNTTNDIFNWRANAAVGYSAGAGVKFFNQPGTSPNAFMFLWDQPIPYWFYGNGQRFIVVAKVSTVYESMYGGKWLPYGTPGQYPYPVCIGGTGGDSNSTDPLAFGNQPGVANLRFSDTSINHGAFFNPAALYWIDDAATWHVICNIATGGGGACVFPWYYADTLSPAWLETNLDGSYPLFVARLDGLTPINLLGELDGVAFTTGFSASSESTLTVGSNTWTVFQDTFRTGRTNYCVIEDV